RQDWSPATASLQKNSFPMLWPKCWEPWRERVSCIRSPAARPASPSTPGRVFAAGVFGSENGIDSVLRAHPHGCNRQSRTTGLRSGRFGLGLTLIYLISIPVTNTSVNPTLAPVRPYSSVDGRCISCGCFGWRRLWGVLGGGIYRFLLGKEKR